VTEDEKENARRAVSNELKAMLLLAFKWGEEEDPSAPNPTESQEVKPIRRGHLPKKKGEAGQVPIIAGLLNGEVSRLRVDAQGAWTLEPREDAFAGKPVGGKAKNMTERFVVTRDDGATRYLTITLKIAEKRMRTKGGPIKPTKRAVYVGEKLSSWTHKRHPIRRKEKLDNFARARAFIRTIDEVEHFAGSAPVPLRVQGKLGINQPLVPLAFDDIRNIEFDIEANEAFGDGRKFEGLRFFNAAERLPVDETKGLDMAANDGSSTPKHMDAGSQAGKEPKDEVTREIEPGRPSLKIEIEDACTKLIADGKANLDNRKPNYEPIRKIIRQEHKLPSDAHISGLGDEAIRKVIAPILDDALAALKGTKTASH